MPDLSIDKPLAEHDKDELVALARRVGVERREGDPMEVDPETGELVELPQEVLAELEPGAVVERIVESLSDSELRALPGVKGRKGVRAHRADWEAAARGELVEVEREEAARALVERENAWAEEQLAERAQDDEPVTE